MKVIVFGATGGTGRAVTLRALAAGHSVTAYVRMGQEAVVITLANSQKAFALLFGARRTTPRDACEIGTRNILAAVPQDNRIAIAVVSAFGIGGTRDKLPLLFKLFYRLLLRKQLTDKEKQEAVLRASGAAYVIVHPVALTDKAPKGSWTATRGGVLGQPEVSRGDLAAFLLSVLESGSHRGETITFSGKAPVHAQK